MSNVKIPLTTGQQCRVYGTTKYSCTCADYIHRKGNYSLYGFKMCKHILYKIIEDVRNEYAERLGINTEELTDVTCTHSQLRKALDQPQAVELPFQSGHQVTLGNGKTFTRI